MVTVGMLDGYIEVWGKQLCLVYLDGLELLSQLHGVRIQMYNVGLLS